MQSIGADLCSRIKVVVGIVFNRTRDKILIARRKQSQHLGGLWEFPGGKLEAGEVSRTALQRELMEEVGIEAINMDYFMTITPNYSDKSISLDVWIVSAFVGEVRGLEGQTVTWVKKTDLMKFDFPQANLPILNKIQSLS